MPPWGEWTHDFTLAWLLLLVVGTVLPRRSLTTWPGLIGLGALLAVAPGLGDPVAVGLTLLVGAVLLIDRSFLVWGPITLLAAAALIGRLGATGGPFVTPIRFFSHTGCGRSARRWR